MKKIFQILAICIFPIGCLTQQIKRNTMYTAFIDGKFEKFDSTLYHQLKEKNPHNTSFFSDNGVYIELSEWNTGKGYIESAPNSYFKISKGYYPNGNIKLKGLTFNVPWGGPFLKGTWYEFDEQGKLTKEIDYDTFFKFSFEKVLTWCEKENIRVDKGPIMQSTGFHTIIRRGHNNKSSWWEVEWLKKPDLIEITKIDGNTGVIISRTDKEYINN